MSEFAFVMPSGPPNTLLASLYNCYVWLNHLSDLRRCIKAGT
jgi:hypothetical protein